MSSNVSNVSNFHQSVGYLPPTMPKRFLLMLAAAIILAVLCAPLHANSLCVDNEHSHFRIRVASAGLFSALGHDHLIEARQIKGCSEIDWSQLEHSSVSLTFSTPAILVLDPDHAKDQPKVQETMETEVLHTHDFPEIQFKSTALHSRPNTGEWTVDGQLTIRGQTQNVSIPLKLEHNGTSEARITGKYTLKLSKFGIKPIQVMGGMVSVKDDIQLEFDLQLRETR
jgi:polyisoprenoid-binding protein YceI